MALLGVLSTSIAADKTYGSVLVDEIPSVYDGDTFRVNINAWPGIIGYRVPVRIDGIDTPELRGKCQAEKDLARKAKQFTVSMLRSAKKIELRNMKRGKYFRIVANVSIDGMDLGEKLIREGLAIKYDGRGQTIWCGQMQKEFIGTKS